ncbi:MAG: AAA family ATPase [Mycobacteriales bacterium]|nr:MAG: AAA family ATPase [Pseudonocardiales bacterium]
MTLQDDLAQWAAYRPDWQKDAIARYCRNESLSDDDIKSIADQFIAGPYPKVTPITAKDIPGSSPSGDPVSLVAIRDVAGINALLSGQRLSFGESGLTVIYGDNASGKSGYARLIREAVTARVKGDLLGNVFAHERADQLAVFEFAVGGVAAEWTLGEVASQQLSAVRFYDEECGDAYVTTASEINYRPSALTLLDRLSADCDRLQGEVTARLDTNRGERPDLPLLSPETGAWNFLNSLSAKSTSEQIDQAVALEPDHQKVLAASLAEEARLKGSDPSKEKQRLKQLAQHWTVVRDHIVRLSDALSTDALADLEGKRKKAVDLRQAVQITSAKDFNAEPLSGVASDTWRELWEAARAYSESEAYHDHEFPHTGDGAVCVLCQQPLGPDASARLRRFRDFMTDTTARDADEMERVLAQARAAVAQLQTQPIALSTALTQLGAGGEDVATVETWLTGAFARATAVVAWLDSPDSDRPIGLTVGPSEAGEARSTKLTDQSAAIDDSTFAANLQAVATNVRELQARISLAAAKRALITEVARLQRRVKIEDTKRYADTTGITRKATDLTTAYVTSLVRDRFTRETENLRLRKVTLDPTGGRKKVTLQHMPKLLGATVPAEIDSVLSEGEQTALGLAGFLTETEFDGSKSAVVFDDPVSSLDAGRRSHVAKRLTQLAQDRQVIVFTHEATFVTALNKRARDLSVQVTERAIIRQGEEPGKTTEQHPWNVRDTAERINDMRKELADLRKDRSSLDSDEYTRRAQDFGGRLSQTWERAVNIEIVNRVVDRGTNEVRPTMFRLLATITPDDDKDFQAGYSRASEWALRHDQAPETNFIAPEPDDLEEELDRLDNWLKRVKKYQREVS